MEVIVSAIIAGIFGLLAIFLQHHLQNKNLNKPSQNMKLNEIGSKNNIVKKIYLGLSGGFIGFFSLTTITSIIYNGTLYTKEIFAIAVYAALIGGVCSLLSCFIPGEPSYRRHFAPSLFIGFSIMAFLFIA